MKKSEKIEIRISYEEKESLTRLAENEGYSVSELVRGLARKYAQLHMPISRRKLSSWHMAGLIMCGIGIGSGVALSLKENTAQSKDTQFMVHGVIDGYGFGFGVTNTPNQTENVLLGDGIGAFKIVVSVKRGGSDHNVADISICKQKEDICLSAAQAVLDVNLPNSPSVWQTGTDSGENLFLVLQPI